MSAMRKGLKGTLAAVCGRRGVSAPVDTARATQFEQLRELAASRDVIGLGIGEKHVLGQPAGEVGIVFYVRHKKPLGRMRGRQVVPPVIALWGGRAIVTDVVELGELTLDATRRAGRPPALRSGASVAHFRDTAGTLGAVVLRDGVPHILSNAHVLALSGRARSGDAILLPGPTDGGHFPADAVALLTESAPLVPGGAHVNLVDAALARIAPEQMARIDRHIAGASTPIRTTPPRRGMTVTKFGKTSGATTGVVRDVDFEFSLPYPHLRRRVGFFQQVLCSRFTDEGDSGSIVVEARTGKVVGIHFATAPGGSVFSPIASAMKALRFTFDRKDSS